VNTEYAIRVLKENQSNLKARLREIEEGRYNGYNETDVKKLKTRMLHDSRSLEFSIEVLETYLD